MPLIHPDTDKRRAGLMSLRAHRVMRCALDLSLT